MIHVYNVVLIHIKLNKEIMEFVNHVVMINKIFLTHLDNNAHVYIINRIFHYIIHNLMDNIHVKHVMI